MAGDAYLKSLADQYRNGRRNGTNIPPALEIKAQLQRKIDGYKQQLHDYNYQRQDDVLLERERKRQFMPAGREISVPLSKGEFVTALLRLIMDLDKITGQHPDIADAIEDLRLPTGRRSRTGRILRRSNDRSRTPGARCQRLRRRSLRWRRCWMGSTPWQA